MNELEAAFCRIHLRNDTDMSDTFGRTATSKEYEVTLLQIGHISHTCPFIVLSPRRMRKFDIVLTEHKTCKSRTIKSIGTAMSATVSHAEIFVGGGEKIVKQVLRRFLFIHLGFSGLFGGNREKADGIQLLLRMFYLGLDWQRVASDERGILFHVVFITRLDTDAVCRREPRRNS